MARPARFSFWPQSRKNRWAATTLILLIVLPYAMSRFSAASRRVKLIHTQVSFPDANLIARAGTGNIRVLSFNIAHGRGLSLSNWKGGSKQERQSRLERIATLLRDQAADIVVLNEVDFNASWSSGVNQAEYLAHMAGYPYRIEQRNLDFRIALWNWKFGNAILSRVPLQDAKLIELPDYARWETVLAGKKRAVTCLAQTPDGPIRIIAAHLSSRSESLRVASAKELMRLTQSSSQPVVVAGDLNSTPTGFPLSESDSAGANAIDLIDESAFFRRQPIGKPISSSLHTFHSAAPKRVIDWILIPASSEFANYQVLDTNLSDHRPIVADVSELRME